MSSTIELISLYQLVERQLLKSTPCPKFFLCLFVKGMAFNPKTDVAQAIAALYRTEWGRIVAILIRLVGDFDVAEEAAQAAFTAAVNQWESDGIALLPCLDYPNCPVQGDRLPPTMHETDRKTEVVCGIWLIYRLKNQPMTVMKLKTIACD
ncbi:hypothetical protein [Nostoc sp.]